MDTKQFIQSLGDFDKFEFSNLFSSLSFDQVDNAKDMYFVGETNNTSIRSKKENIVKRNYFVVDFDIRQNKKTRDGIVISDDELAEGLLFIKETLGNEKMLCDRRYIVFSGNGYHFYYTGDRNYNERQYEMGVEYIYNKIDKLLGNELFRSDHTCKTVNRLTRLPGSTNTKRKTNHGLDEKKCEILETQDKDTELMQLLPKLAEKQNELNAKEYVKKIEKQEEKHYSSQRKTYDAICEIPIGDVVCKATGLQMQPDNKNFKSPKNGDNIGMFISDNILVYSGTHYISGKHAGYNTFSFVRDYYNLDSAGTFKKFCEDYHWIATIDKENKADRKKQQQESEKPIISDPLDYCMTYGELLERAKNYRQSIDRSKLCTFGVDGIDKYLQGILPDDLILIGADTGCGKSEIAYNIAIKNAMKGKKVMLFALEGSLEEIALRHIQREIAKTKEIYTAQYRFNGQKYREEEEQVIKGIHENIKNNLFIYNKTAKTNLAFVKDMLVKSKEKMDLFVIDHLHYIHLETENENREVGEIMREIKLITDTIKKPVVLISHLRKPSQRKENKPSEFDLHGSSNISKEATVILLIYKSTSCNMDCKTPNLIETGFYSPKSRPGLGRITFNGIYDVNKKDYLDDRKLDEEGSDNKESSFAMKI